MDGKQKGGVETYLVFQELVHSSIGEMEEQQYPSTQMLSCCTLDHAVGASSTRLGTFWALKKKKNKKKETRGIGRAESKSSPPQSPCFGVPLTQQHNTTQLCFALFVNITIHVSV